jgi:hypothetical protein
MAAVVDTLEHRTTPFRTALIVQYCPMALTFATADENTSANLPVDISYSGGRQECRGIPFALRSCGVFLLCIFVFSLAFTAKRSQYGDPDAHGSYLEQSVKMENRFALDQHLPCFTVEDRSTVQELVPVRILVARPLFRLTPTRHSTHSPLLI